MISKPRPVRQSAAVEGVDCRLGRILVETEPHEWIFKDNIRGVGGNPRKGEKSQENQIREGCFPKHRGTLLKSQISNVKFQIFKPTLFADPLHVRTQIPNRA